MTKEQKYKQIANLIGMLESQQDNFLADGSDVDMEVTQVLDSMIEKLTSIWNDVTNDEFVF